MYSISSAGHSRADIAASSVLRDALSARLQNFARLVAIALAAATLAACAQSSVTNRSDLRATSRQGAQEGNRENSVVANRRVVIKTIKHTPFPADRNAAKAQVASHGIASFYTEEQLTANGENFNPNELTAAHPTLPFGTRLRVTNVATGRSVTVRVNDRGPYVPGRIVDVSYSAAETLGIVGQGVAKVKLDVVH
jgi:peptidoglycan lytic transglycosylase